MHLPPSPACWWWIREAGLLLCWQLWLCMYSVGFFVSVFVFFLLIMLPSEIPKLPTDPPVGGFPTGWSPPSRLAPQDRSWSLSLLSLSLSLFFFCLLYFVLPPFQENWLPFWVPDILHQHLIIVLWKLFNIQMNFWWISGEESGLPVLFLYHLGTAFKMLLFKN